MKKRNIFLAALLFVALVGVGKIAYDTYARYLSETSGNAEVSAAVWSMKVNTEDVTTGTTLANNLPVTLNESTLVAAGKIAPGRGGYVDLEIDPTGTEVAFDYTVEIDPATGENLPSGFQVTGYAIKSGESYPTATSITGGTFTAGVELATDNDGSRIAMDDTKKVNCRVYFDWVNNEANNAEDTKAEGTEITVPITITLSQKLN